MTPSLLPTARGPQNDPSCMQRLQTLHPETKKHRSAPHGCTRGTDVGHPALYTLQTEPFDCRRTESNSKSREKTSEKLVSHSVVADLLAARQKSFAGCSCSSNDQTRSMHFKASTVKRGLPLASLINQRPACALFAAKIEPSAIPTLASDERTCRLHVRLGGFNQSSRIPSRRCIEFSTAHKILRLCMGLRSQLPLACSPRGIFSRRS